MVLIRMGWRRRADSNRRIKVLQTSALATWLRRHEIGNDAVIQQLSRYEIMGRHGLGNMRDGVLNLFDNGFAGRKIGAGNGI